MVGGVGWGSPFSRVFSGFSCSGSVFSPKAELRRWRRWESWRESGTAAGVKLSRRRLGWGRCRWVGVRRLCATALKLCVMRSLLFSFPLSVSFSVCLRWTVPGLLLLGDGRRLGDRDGWPGSAGRRRLLLGADLGHSWAGAGLRQTAQIQWLIFGKNSFLNGEQNH